MFVLFTFDLKTYLLQTMRKISLSKIFSILKKICQYSFKLF